MRGGSQEFSVRGGDGRALPLLRPAPRVGAGIASGPRRRVSVGGKRVRTVDVHCHCTIPEVIEVVKDTPLEARARTASAVPGNNPPLDKRLAQMDAQGIDVEAMSINEWWYGADRDLARRIVDLQNETLMQRCKEVPDRLVAFATVALQFPELAAEQLETAMKQQGLRGAGIGCSVAGDELSNPRFDPFWQKAEELQALLFLHPQDSDAATGITRRVQGYGALANVIGNPLETTIALSHLIMDGTLDRFPEPAPVRRPCRRLSAVLCRAPRSRLHCPADVLQGPRAEEAPERVSAGRSMSTRSIFTPEGLRHLAKEVGPRQIMIGTDYGFPWVEDPVGLVLSTPGLSDADKVAILGGTAAKLLRL